MKKNAATAHASNNALIDSFGPEDEKRINKHFWNLKDHDLQKAYHILYLIKYVNVQKQKQSPGSN